MARFSSLRVRYGMAAIAGGAAAVFAVPAVGAPNVEVGGVVGGHQFSENDELGVPDAADAASLASSVLFGLRLGYYFQPMLGVEGELGLLPTEARGGVFDVWAMTYRAHLIAQFGADDPARKLVPFVLVGGGAMAVLSSANEMVISKDTDEVLYAGAGLKYRAPGGWGLRFDVRALFPPSNVDEFATFSVEGLFSAYREWGRPQPAPVVEAPPPPPPSDRDGDGLADEADQCPDEPEDFDGFEDADGCPEPDNDGDGVADAVDRCPLDPEDLDGFQDEDGCPDGDNDGDGIADAQDQCPNDAEDVDGFQDQDGCPDPDNDGDGVLDGQDQCPTELETWNGYQDEDGCPDDLPQPVRQYTGVIKGITFKTNSATILKASNKTLDAAVKVLNEYPDLRIEIHGHTDDTGDDAYNLDLSQRRAEAVKAYFVGKGVDEGRIVARGFGRDQPVDPRKTAAARAKNRRVEFHVITSQPGGGAQTQP